MTTATPERRYTVRLRRPHARQVEFLSSPAKRVIIRAGRRGGKTTGIAIKAVQAFLDGRRILYATPTQEQVDAFWWEVKRALAEPLDAGVYYKNESLHVIEREGTRQRIRAKTAWNADSLRGDYADLLILDEYQLMDEDAWELVGAPMLLDNDGDAVFIYTPPSLRSRSVSKARDPRHAAKMYKRAEKDESGRWATFTFGSRDNPHISPSALSELASDMSALAIRQEIEAEDIDEVPGALWNRNLLDSTRRDEYPELVRVVVGVDPSGGGDEVGIVVAGRGRDGHGYVLADYSVAGSVGPRGWATQTVDAYEDYEADRIAAEKNFGGEMVEYTIRTVDPNVPVKLIHASRGKDVRAEPVAALYEKDRVHHVGEFPTLEDELTGWAPGDPESPNRLDALVWALTEVMDIQRKGTRRVRFF